ncbi:hypothetical protein KHA80_17225 [Anaerobacillus sp. HL2]|nr:hypothetical protein KHA80_17225 [Anaerobacillus sp. HL2]
MLVVPTEKYMGTIDSLRNFTLIAIGSSSIISILLLIIFISITKPSLTMLRNVMREVRNGDMTKDINIKATIPEINSLMKSFNQMMEQMKKMISKLTYLKRTVSYRA